MEQQNRKKGESRRESSRVKSTTDLQTLQEQTHPVTVEEHLTVVRSLIRDVPQSTPGELHHLVTLRDRKTTGLAEPGWTRLNQADPD